MSSILFPGQGSQVVGMGSEFYNNFDMYFTSPIWIPYTLYTARILVNFYFK